MQSSSYNIYVPLPDEADAYLILHGYTGAVDRVSGDVAQYLMEGPTADPGLSPKTLETLARRGYLTSRTEEEETAHVIRLATALHRRHCQGAAFLFAPTFRCQFRCVYCFEADLVRRSDDSPKATMTPEQVDAAYLAMESILQEKNKQQPKEITLYGGEPLMAENVTLLTYIVEEGMHRGYRFRAITNGYDLAFYEYLLAKDKIGYLQITIDGLETVHNRRRPGKGGTPTFLTICDNVTLALSKGCTVVLRTNVDQRNLDSLGELAKLYQAKGWSAHPSFHPYAHVVHGPRGRNAQIQPIELLARRELLTKEIGDACRPIEIDFGISHILGGLVRGGKFPALRPYYCGSQIGSYIFGPDDHIYTCWDELGMEEGRLGRYFPALRWNADRAQQWIDRNIANMPACQKCPWALLCGGGCAYQARVSTGSMFSAYCFQFQEAFLHAAPWAYRRLEKAEVSVGAAEGVEQTETVTCA